MQKSIFKITHMDCPSEEQIIRMKLSGVAGISAMDFDLAGRVLTIYHNGKYDEIFRLLDSLNFGTSLVSSEESKELHPHELQQAYSDRTILVAVLVINALFFLVELLFGYVFNSMGLSADSLDMLADSIVYGLSLIAVSGSVLFKKYTARTAGIFQLLLAALGLFETVKRFIINDKMPAFTVMIVVSLLALTANSFCLILLQKSKNREAHIQASLIFTNNDIIANVVVILAGVFVYFTDSRYPDLIAGSVIFILVLYGALRILKLSK